MNPPEKSQHSAPNLLLSGMTLSLNEKRLLTKSFNQWPQYLLLSNASDTWWCLQTLYTACENNFILWRVGCLPPNYQHLPVPYSPPFTRLPTGVGVWERRGAETARSGGVWWGTQLKWMEPHHRRCYMPSALSSGDRSLPRACTLVSSWVQEGSVEGMDAAEGASCRTRGPDEDRTRETADGPGCRARIIPESAAGQEEDEAATWSPPSLVPRTWSRGARAATGLRPSPGPFLPETLPLLHKPAQHNEDTRSPVYFGHFIPFGTLFYYFCLIKASPRPDATPTVSVVCSSRHNIYIV